MAVTEFERLQLSEVRLYPLDLQPEEPRGRRGAPRLADESLVRPR